MLNLQGITFRIGGRVLLDGASVAIPTGHKVGLVGRNGTGKSTLFKVVLGETSAETGTVQTARKARIGSVAQEAPGGPETLLSIVLAGDQEREELLARAVTEEDGHAIAEIQTRLADIAAHAAPARAAAILAGLGFSDAQINAPCSTLSGGWRMRVALAAALFGKPDVLLLDEPTNYLDFEGTIWLTNYLRTYPATLLMISHDRNVLNQVVDAIAHLDNGKLTLYQGTYDSFDRQRREKQALNAKFRKKQEAQRAHMQAYVDRFRYKASKARQAQSRLKALAKLEPIAEVIESRVAEFHFPDPERALAPPLVSLDKASVGYRAGKPVLRNLTLRIDPDDRIALLGSNGNGKSTLAKLLTGRLAPQSGTQTTAPRLTFGYFAQHQMDELSDNRTPFDYITDLMPDAAVAARRARLGAAGFGITLADSKCATLSGGEKARLLFLLATFHAPHCLILDEPTNHLDMDSRESLIMAINDFAGAVILIAHDKHIIETCADQLWLVENGTVTPFDDDLDAYAAYVMSGRAATPSATPAAPSPPAEKRIAAPAKSLQKRLRDIEAMMADMRGKVAVLDAALADHAIYREEPRKAADFARLRTRLAADLDSIETQWLVLQETLADV